MAHGMHYAKSGKQKKVSVGKFGKHVFEQRAGSPYHYNPKCKRSDDEAYRNMTNDYGKTAQPQDRITDGIRQHPGRTMIRI